jgi:hypothetical protein
MVGSVILDISLKIWYYERSDTEYAYDQASVIDDSQYGKKKEFHFIFASFAAEILNIVHVF